MSTESVKTTDGYNIKPGALIYDAEGCEYSFLAMYGPQYICNPVIEVSRSDSYDEETTVVDHLVPLAAVYHAPPTRKYHEHINDLKNEITRLKQRISVHSEDVKKLDADIWAKRNEISTAQSTINAWQRQLTAYEKNHTSLKSLQQKVYDQETGELGFLQGIFSGAPYISVSIGYNRAVLPTTGKEYSYPGPLKFEPCALSHGERAHYGELIYNREKGRYHFIPASTSGKYLLPAAVAAVNERLAREVADKFWSNGVTQATLDTIAALVARCDQVNAEYNVSIIVPDELRKLQAVAEEAQHAAKERRRLALQAELAKIQEST